MLAVQCEGAALGITSVLSDLSYEYGTIHRQSIEALTNAIFTSLLEEMATAIVTLQSTINPAQIIQNVQQRYHRSSEADHMALELQAERIIAEEYDDIGSYFLAHERVRAIMIEANHPGVMDERITIKFLLKGLRLHPTHQQVVTQ